MTNNIRVMLEIGPKGKKVVAVAPDWPGLSRGAKSEEAAVERLLAYAPRYAPVANRAGMSAPFATLTRVNVVERYPGTGSTDFWGISFAFSSFDRQPMSTEALEHDLTLLRASWAFFDDVRAQVSPEMQRGPRGGEEVDVTLELDLEPRIIELPQDLKSALIGSGALNAFENSAPSMKKEYVRQVEEAKAQATRERRIAKIVEKLSAS